MKTTNKTPQTLQEAIVYFSDPERAFVYAVNLRWPDGNVLCPRCGNDKHSFVKTRLLWFCKGCKKQFTMKVGNMPDKVVRRGMELFRDRVQPALRDL